MPKTLTMPSHSSRPGLAPRPLSAESLLLPGVYRSTPLCDDIARVSHPATPLDDRDVMSILVKYFHAFIFPGSEKTSVPLADISDIFDQFRGFWSPDGAVPDEHPALFGTSGYALRMLADLPKTAHIFRSIARRPFLDADVSESYQGLDLGAGTGVMLLAALLQARRNGAGRVGLLGVEYDPDVAARADLLTRSLEAGTVRAADARSQEAYQDLGQGDLAFVANETVPAVTQRLETEHFTAIHGTLFSACARRLKKTVFFPEALVTHEPGGDLSVVLSKNNRFQVPRYYRHMRLFPQAVVIEGRLVRLHLLGRDFTRFIPPAWQKALPRRW